MKKYVLTLLLALSLFGVRGEKVEAVTWTEVGGHITVVANTNKTAYAPGEAITVSTAVSFLVCKNIGYPTSIGASLGAQSDVKLYSSMFEIPGTMITSLHLTAPTTPGTYDVTVTVVSVNELGNTVTSSRDIPITVVGPNPNPIGSLESATCETVQGWTCDGSIWAKQLDVHIYEGGTFVGSAVANVNREAAIGVACGNGASAHGFSYTVPNSLKDGTAHSLTAYALGINSSGVHDGNNPALGTKTTPVCAIAVTPTGTWTAPACPVVCGSATTTPAYTCVGGNGFCAVTTPATRLCAATPVCAIIPTTPSGLTVTPQACNSGQNYLDWNDVPNAVNYSIYTSDGTWIGNSPVSNYSHNGSLNTSYSYFVRANSNTGTQSGNSAIVSSTIAGVCVPSDTLAATGCDISYGQSTCDGSATWNIEYATNPNLYNGNGTTYSGTNVASGNNVQITLTYGINDIYARDGVTNRKTVNVSALCGSAAPYWNGTYCDINSPPPLPPTINLSIDKDLVRSGTPATLDFTLTASYPTKCTVRGAESGPIVRSYAAGTITDTYITRPLTSAQVVEVSCEPSPAITGTAAATDEARVEVVPTIIEI